MTQTTSTGSNGPEPSKTLPTYQPPGHPDRKPMSPESRAQLKDILDLARIEGLLPPSPQSSSKSVA